MNGITRFTRWRSHDRSVYFLPVPKGSSHNKQIVLAADPSRPAALQLLEIPQVYLRRCALLAGRLDAQNALFIMGRTLARVACNPHISTVVRGLLDDA